MPLIRIATKKKLASDLQSKVSDAIQVSIESDLNAPHNDRFQIFSDHDSGMIFDRNFMNVQRSDELLFIHVFLKKGRTEQMKKAFYSNLNRRLGELGIRKDDVFIVLTENDASDWSFGDGLAQLVP
jgi:hypothetical protein